MPHAAKSSPIIRASALSYKSTQLFLSIVIFAVYLARVACLSCGLYLPFALVSFFFIINGSLETNSHNLLSTCMYKSSIFIKFSPSGRNLAVDYWSNLIFLGRLRDVAMASNLRGKIGLFAFFVGFAFRNGLEYRNADGRDNNCNEMVNRVKIWWTSVRQLWSSRRSPEYTNTQFCFTYSPEGVTAMLCGLHVRLCQTVTHF